MRRKIARSLLAQRDQRRRNRHVLIGALTVLLLFLAHAYFTNLSSPLKLIPQMCTAMAMGWVLLYITSLRQFEHVVEFIDWSKVTDVAETGDQWE